MENFSLRFGFLRLIFFFILAVVSGSNVAYSSRALDEKGWETVVNEFTHALEETSSLSGSILPASIDYRDFFYLGLPSYLQEATIQLSAEQCEDEDNKVDDTPSLKTCKKARINLIKENSEYKLLESMEGMLSVNQPITSFIGQSEITLIKKYDLWGNKNITSTPIPRHNYRSSLNLETANYHSHHSVNDMNYTLEKFVLTPTEICQENKNCLKRYMRDLYKPVEISLEHLSFGDDVQLSADLTKVLYSQGRLTGQNISFTRQDPEDEEFLRRTTLKAIAADSWLNGKTAEFHTNIHLESLKLVRKEKRDWMPNHLDEAFLFTDINFIFEEVNQDESKDKKGTISFLGEMGEITVTFNDLHTLGLGKLEWDLSFEGLYLKFLRAYQQILASEKIVKAIATGHTDLKTLLTESEKALPNESVAETVFGNYKLTHTFDESPGFNLGVAITIDRETVIKILERNHFYKDLFFSFHHFKELTIDMEMPVSYLYQLLIKTKILSKTSFSEDLAAHFKAYLAQDTKEGEEEFRKKLTEFLTQQPPSFQFYQAESDALHISLHYSFDEAGYIVNNFATDDEEISSFFDDLIKFYNSYHW